MKPNTILFADLSTYSPDTSILFYEQVFGWKYYKTNNYYTAYLGNVQVSGLYETPEKFKQMRMPHFWMTYISVSNINLIVKKAWELGGIIELEQTIDGFGKVALIRDPKGAGFTIYEGTSLKSTRTKNNTNTLIWNELHVSEVNKVIPFYQGIFNWEIQQERNNHFKVYNSQKEYIADILEIQNDFKGNYEYWICCFAVENLERTTKRVLDNGGNLINDEGYRRLFTDHSGQAFFYATQL